jgi:hypothetical protein
MKELSMTAIENNTFPESLKKTLASIDWLLHALAPTKDEWREAMDDLDQCRCAHCNTVLDLDVFSSLVQLENGLKAALEHIGRQAKEVEIIGAGMGALKESEIRLAQ